MCIGESEACGQLSAIRFRDVFLDLKLDFEALALELAENGPRPGALSLGRRVGGQVGWAGRRDAGDFRVGRIDVGALERIRVVWIRDGGRAGQDFVHEKVALVRLQCGRCVDVVIVEIRWFDKCAL